MEKKDINQRVITKSSQELLLQLHNGFPLPDIGSGETDEEYERTIALYKSVVEPIRFNEKNLDDPNLSIRLEDLKKQYPELYKRYLSRLRERDTNINNPFKKFDKAIRFVKEHPLDEEDKERIISEIKSRVITPESLDKDQANALKKLFPTGNYLYHGTDVSAAIDLLNTGEIASVGTRKRRGDKDVYSRGGSVGISWNYNEINVLPGDEYHLVGFLTSPEVALKEGVFKLSVPAGAGENELILVNGDIDFKRYRIVSEQMGAFNASLWAMVNYMQEYEKREKPREDKLGLGFDFNSHFFDCIELVKNGQLTEVELASYYTLDSVGKLTFNPDLFTDNRIDILALLVHCYLNNPLIESGKGKKLVNLTKEDVLEIMEEGRKKIWLPQKREVEKEYEALEKQVGEVTLDTGVSIFVIPSSDAEYWYQILARCKKLPEMILVYSSRLGPRVPNWKEYFGEHKKMEEIIQRTFEVAEVPDQRIPWEKITGKQLTKESYGLDTLNHLIRWSNIKDSKDLVWNNNLGTLEVK